MLAAGFALAVETNSVAPATEAPPQAAVVSGNSRSPELQLTEIKSKSGQFFIKSNVFVYRGEVHIDDPRMKLTCELLTVEAPKLNTGKFNRATAETNVVIDWTDEKGLNHATSEKAVYTYILTNINEQQLATNETVVLTGGPVVTNSQGIFQGDPIIWDRISDTITSPNFVNMKINQSTTNTPGIFETPGSSKPNTGGNPK